MRNGPIALVVSADRHLRQLIVAGLGDVGCTTYDTGSHATAIAYTARTCVDVAVIDVRRPGAGALERETIRQLRANEPNLHVLYLIKPGDTVLERELAGATDTCSLHKPFRLDELCDIVSSWLEDGVAFHTVTSLAVH